MKTALRFLALPLFLFACGGIDDEPRDPQTQGVVTPAETKQLASIKAGANEIAIDAEHLYWASYEEGTIKKVPRAGGEVVTLATGEDHPIGIAIDGKNVYWVAYGTALKKAPLAGGPAVTLAKADAGTLYGVAVDATHAYATDYAGGAILRVAIEGPTDVTPIVPMSTGGGPVRANAVTVSGGYVYWAVSGEGTGKGRIMRVAVDGKGLPMLLTGGLPGHTSGIAVDGDTLYFTIYDERGSVHAVPVAGGITRTIARDQKFPTHVVVNGGRVFWTNSDEGRGDGSIMVAKKDGSVTVLAGALPGPYSIAVDGADVFWSTRDPKSPGIFYAKTN